MPELKVKIRKHSSAPEVRVSPNEELPYPVDTGAAIEKLIKEYNSHRQPINISIRSLVSWMKVGERGTHYIHPYPAKLLPHIAHLFFASKMLCPSEGVVLDPFAGSGTVPLEAMLSGRRALFADSNPLARLITKAKTHPISEALVDQYTRELVPVPRQRSSETTPDVVNIDKWFSKDVISSLSGYRGAIDRIDRDDVRTLMQVTFSAVVRKVSNADLRFPVPVIKRDYVELGDTDVARLFHLQLQANKSRLRQFDLSKFIVPQSAGIDARSLRTPDDTAPLPDSSVDMIMTSPPYAGAQKYVRATSLSLGWLGLTPRNELRKLEDQTIGREHYSRRNGYQLDYSGVFPADELINAIHSINPLRAKIAATYLQEMKLALREAERVLKPGGHIILVIGDNTVCGLPFRTSEYLKAIIEGLGLATILWLVDPIRSRGLMTRRATTAGMIAHESVMVFKKPGDLK